MNVYSPSHPTDQDMDVESLGDKPTPTEEDAMLHCGGDISLICKSDFALNKVLAFEESPKAGFSMFDDSRIHQPNLIDSTDSMNAVQPEQDADGSEELTATPTLDDADNPVSDLNVNNSLPATDNAFDSPNEHSKDHPQIPLQNYPENGSTTNNSKSITPRKDHALLVSENAIKETSKRKLSKSEHIKPISQGNAKQNSTDKSEKNSHKGDREENTKQRPKEKSVKSNAEENSKRSAKDKADNDKLITEENVNKDKQLKDETVQSSTDKSVSSHGKSDKDNHSSHSKSRSSRNRSRTPSSRRRDKSKDRRSSRRRSSSRSRRRRYSRSHSRERRHRRSRSNSHSRHSQRGRDLKRSHRSRTRSRDRNERRSQNDTSKSRQEKSLLSDIPKHENSRFSPQPCPPPPPVPVKPIDVLKFDTKLSASQWDEGDDMEETSTPDIAEDQPRTLQNLMDAQFDHDNMSNDLAAVFMLRNQPPPPPPPPQTTTPEFVNWRQHYLNQQNDQQNQFQQPSNQFPGGFPHQHFYPPGQDGVPPPSLNPIYQQIQLNNFPPGNPPPQMVLNGMPLNPLMNFSQLMSQPPPPPNIPPMAYCAPPPPPFIQHFQPPPLPPQIVSAGQQYEQPPVEAQASVSEPRQFKSRFSDKATPQETPNLLETLMSKAGLRTDSISGLNTSQHQPAPISSSVPFSEPVEDKSPMKKINKLLNSAANTLLSHLNEAQKTLPGSISPPPPPPPPLPFPSNPSHTFLASPGKSFVPPPLPTISGNTYDVNTLGNGRGDQETEPKKHKHLTNYDVREMLAKRRRSEFATTLEWQERIALEVKSFIKPTYAAGRLSKEDCRVILKKSVTEISRSKCTSINTKKIGEYTKAYLKKYYKYRKLQQKQRMAAEAKTSIVQ